MCINAGVLAAGTRLSQQRSPRALLDGALVLAAQSRWPSSVQVSSGTAGLDPILVDPLAGL